MCLVKKTNSFLFGSGGIGWVAKSCKQNNDRALRWLYPTNGWHVSATQMHFQASRRSSWRQSVDMSCVFRSHIDIVFIKYIYQYNVAYPFFFHLKLSSRVYKKDETAGFSLLHGASAKHEYYSSTKTRKVHWILNQSSVKDHNSAQSFAWNTWK